MRANALKWGMSLSPFGNASPETLCSLASVGASVAELSFRPADLAALNFQETAKNAERAGISLWSLHLPFYPNTVVNPASLSRDVRENTVRVQSEYIRKAADVGIPIAVIHPSNGPIEESDRAEAMAHAKDVLARLAEIASHAGITLAVENMTRDGLGRRSSELLALLLADERLRVCFDANHPLLENPCDYFCAVADRVVTLHLSDYDGLNERHWMPGTGIIDWKRFVCELEASGYTGPWMYEIGLAETETLSHSPITVSQVRENRDALTNLLPASPVGIIHRENCLKNSFYSEVQYG